MARELIEVGLSVFLGIVWFTACVPKVRHPRSFAVTVLSYGLLPAPLALGVSRVLPPVELTLAVVLVCGFALPAAGVVSALALTAFLAAMIINLARGRRIECGCGALGGSRTIGAVTIARAGVLLGCSVALAIIAPPAWTAFLFPVIGAGGSFHALWDAALCFVISAVLWALVARPPLRRLPSVGTDRSIAPGWKERGGNG